MLALGIVLVVVGLATLPSQGVGRAGHRRRDLGLQGVHTVGEPEFEASVWGRVVTGGSLSLATVVVGAILIVLGT